MSTHRLGVAAGTIAIAELAILAWGVLALLSPQQLAPGYEEYTGQSWGVLTQQAPSTAGYIRLLSRLVGALNVTTAVPLLVIALTAFRAGHPWAWWTLLVGNTLAFAAPITYDLTTGAVGVFEILEWVLLGAVYAALAATWSLAHGRAVTATDSAAADLGTRER